MSFFKDPFGNISGGIHDLGKGIANATKNPLVDMAAAAALDYFTGGAAGMLGEAGAMGSVTGLGAAGNAALLTGGIAGLASGNLAQGFMAGVAGWGGASAGESLGMGGYGSAPVTAPGVAGTPVGSTVAETVKAGTGAGTLATNNVAEYINAPGGLDENLVNSVAPTAPATATPMPEAPANPYSVTPSAPTAPLGSGEGLKLAANTPLGTSGLTAGAPISTSGLGSLAKDPSLWTQFKGLPWYAQAGIGAAGVAGLKAMAKPQPLNVPKQANTQFIRNYNYNPFGGYSGQGVVPAATGGLVALAEGGIAHFDGSEGSVVTSDSGYTSYTPEQIQSYFAANPTADVAAAIQEFHADPAAVAAAGYVPAAAPNISASFFAPGGQGSQIAALEGQSLTGANAAQQVLNPYNSITNDQYAAFFADPKNAAVLNTPGGLAAAEKQYNADPAAAMAYLQSNADKLNLSGADIYQIGQGQGVQGVYDAIDKGLAANPNFTLAQARDAMKAAGISDADVTNYFNRANSAYGTNLATGKAFTGAGDLWSVLAPANQQGGQGGLSQINSNINNWVATHLPATTSLTQAQDAMSAAGINELDVQRATGKTSAQLYHDIKVEQKTGTGGTNTGVGGTNTAPATTTQTVLPTNPQTNAPAGTTNPYGNINNPGDITRNADGTITVQPNIPGRPYGGYSGLTELTNAYTAGGGHTGYVSPTVANLANFNTKYNTQTGGSQAAYDYLMGKSPYPTVPSTPTGEISKPYNTSVMGMLANPAYTVSQPLIFDAATRSYKPNPNFDPHFSATRDYLQSGQVGISPKTAQMLGYKDLGNGIYGFPNSDGTFTGTDGKNYDATGTVIPVKVAANGGLMGLAGGGVGTLGSYSDGGRLLRGPGDGISDSIPATIGSGNPQPARLADGEFVVPARIVSELGNGSTEAGARKLYQMMDRVQNARKKTTGKKQVAANPNAQQYLPA